MHERALGDFTTNGRRLAVLSAIAAPLGAVAGLVAWALLRLIGLITHVAYTGRVGWSLMAPRPGHWGPLSVAVPVVGGLLVGILAKYGSDQIRGHGIPEAIQAILEHESRMAPRVAVVKPLASAITIGTGGPFGAEGPIIMTGGAIGSIAAQGFQLSSLERRTLLVAGAAGGMAATFGSPIAAVLLAVELLLFEWRPRSLIPVAIASAVADGVRVLLLGTAPIFATPKLGAVPWLDVALAVIIGLVAGGVSGILTKLVYLVEDAYRRLPIHWAWWPAIGGVFVGLGGLVDPRALGVGYPTIRALDSGHVLVAAALALLAVKAAIWILSLSSGTSGGVLAPLLMLGGALGMVVGAAFPGHTPGVWATVGMAAMLGGTMRAPLTATVFALETTHAWGLALPLLMGSIAGMAVTVLWIPRSILTEKVARRGVHVAREYGVHPLEGLSVARIMVPKEATETVQADESAAQAGRRIAQDLAFSHRAYPVVDANGEAIGTTYRFRLLDAASQQGHSEPVRVTMDPLVTIGQTERVSSLVATLVRTDRREAVVVDRHSRWVGLVTQNDILLAWRTAIAAEEQREAIFHWSLGRARRPGAVTRRTAETPDPIRSSPVASDSRSSLAPDGEDGDLS